MRKAVDGQRMLVYYPERCTGCRYCEIACSFQHFGVIDFEKSHISALFDETRREYEVRGCFHCEDPVCAAACPVEAITKEEDSGWVKINPLKCIGCRFCNYACPMSIPWFNGEHRVSMKCDFCDPVRNGNPACAEFCSPRALEVVTRKEAQKLKYKRYLQREA